MTGRCHLLRSLCTEALLALLLTVLLVGCAPRQRPTGSGGGEGGSGGITDSGASGGTTAAGTGGGAGVAGATSAPGAPVAVRGGLGHTCVRFDSGALRCWGLNAQGQLGYDTTQPVGIGAGLSIAEMGNVPVGGAVKQIALGGSHTCALLVDGRVRCWGSNLDGRLGYGADYTQVGSGEGISILDAGDVPVGGFVKSIAAGEHHTCAVLESGSVRCWGRGGFGQLGHDSTSSVGEHQSIEDAGDVPLGAAAETVSAGLAHTCAVLVGGDVRCWGENFLGQCGYDGPLRVGDGDGPNVGDIGNVPVGGPAAQISAGQDHTCALLKSGAVRCWGFGELGQLGGGNYRVTMGGSSIEEAGDVPLGALVSELTAGSHHNCGLLPGGRVRCWGQGRFGAHGYETSLNVGDFQGLAIVEQGDVTVGVGVSAIGTGYDHTCAITEKRTVRCWGSNASGQLGDGTTEPRGADAGDMPPIDVPLE